MADETVEIQVFDNGPYKIARASSVRYAGERIEVDGELFLCRCGQTRNPPFCDSSHRRIGFDDANPEREPRDIVVWEGRTVRTTFNPNTCMHVFHCKPLKELRQRELEGDDQAATEIMAVVATCPSGALMAEAKAPLSTPPEPDFPAEIDIQEGGEIRIQCAFSIDVPRMERQRDQRATLCRCGLSRNKPWCDGRHRKRDDFR